MYHFLHISIVLNSNTCLKMQKKKTNIKKWFFQQLCLTEMTLSEYLWFQYSIDFWLFNWMFYHHHQAGGFMFLIAVWWPHNIAAKCQKGSCFQSIDRLIQCFSNNLCSIISCIFVNSGSDKDQADSDILTVTLKTAYAFLWENNNLIML